MSTTTSSITDLTSALTTAASTFISSTSSDATLAPASSEMTIDAHLHYVMSAIVGPIVCFFGLAGNILSIITWCRPGMRSSTGRYLTGQAVADFGVLLMFLLCDSLRAWAPDVDYSRSYATFFCYIGFPFFFFFIVLSIWYTVGVTVDRYIMVCWITKAKRYCNEKRANFGLLLITVNSFIINIPHFASYTVVDNDDHSHNGTGNSTVAPDTPKRMAFALTQFGGGEGGQFYEFWIHCIILILIPWVTVLFMNIKIITKITESNKRMADKKTSQSVLKCKQSENQITRLLLTVTFTFLFFIGVQCIIQCLWMQKPPNANWTMVSSAFAFAKTGIVFNSTSNFVLYCMTGKRFRNELLRMLGLAKKDLQLSSLMDHQSSGTRSASTTSSTAVSGMTE